MTKAEEMRKIAMGDIDYSKIIYDYAINKITEYAKNNFVSADIDIEIPVINDIYKRTGEYGREVNEKARMLANVYKKQVVDKLREEGFTFMDSHVKGVIVVEW